MNIIHPSKQKLIIVAVAAGMSFLGFEAVSRAMASFQPLAFYHISWYVYVFLVFWQSFIFDLHLKDTSSWKIWEQSLARALYKRFEYMLNFEHFSHYLNYLVLPSVIYWSTVGFIYINPFAEVIKQIAIAGSSLALGVTFWYMKTVFYGHKQAKHLTRQLIFLAKLYATYGSFTVGFALTRYFGYGPVAFGAVVAILSFALLYQAFFQHHYLSARTIKFLVGTGILMGCLGFAVYLLWNANYFSGALVLAAVYNTIWGLVHHKFIDEDMTREILYEYLAVLFVVLIVILSTTNFSQRI